MYSELNNLNDLYDELVEDYNVTVMQFLSMMPEQPKNSCLYKWKGLSLRFIEMKTVTKRKLGVVNIPHTFIVDQKNQVVYEHTICSR